jgi:GNAT superfamily N-acetyltransferase
VSAGVATRVAGVTLRAATVADVALVGQLIRELAEYEKLAHEAVATDALLERHLFGETPRAEVVLAERDGDVAGFALFFHNFSTLLGRPGLYLEDLYVRPAHRGAGIGRVLMAYLAKLALERGCGRFEWCVLDWNEPATRFYRSLGAEPMSEWTVQRVTGTALEKLAAEF